MYVHVYIVNVHRCVCVFVCVRHTHTHTYMHTNFLQFLFFSGAEGGGSHRGSRCSTLPGSRRGGAFGEPSVEDLEDLASQVKAA